MDYRCYTSNIPLQLFKRKKLKYTYRFLFIPETIGSITLLAKKIIKPEKTEYALVATCVGRGARLHYKKLLQEIILLIM